MPMPPPNPADDPQATERRRRFVVGHQDAFASIWNQASKLYRSRADEAIRDNPENSRKMWRDLWLRSLLQERVLPSCSLKLQVTSDSPKDPAQAAAIGRYARLLEATPRLGPLKRYLTRGSIFFGKYGAQKRTDWRMVDGVRSAVVVDHLPWSGDKINFDWDGVPAVLVRTTVEIPGARFRYSDGAGGKYLMLDTRPLRDRWAIQQADPDDRDFTSEADLAGMAYGEGLRSLLYWPWLLREELTTWTLDALQRIGVNGMLYAYCDSGNPEDEQATLKALADLVANNLAVFKRLGGVDVDGIHSIAPSPVSYEVMASFRDYLNEAIRYAIVGQTLSSTAESTGMGSEVAEFHRSTKENLTRSDVERLGETFTTEMLEPLMRANGDGNLPFRMKVEFLLDREDAKEAMDIAEQAQRIGLDVDEDEIREKAGIRKPSDPGRALRPPGSEPAPTSNAGSPAISRVASPSPPRLALANYASDPDDEVEVEVDDDQSPDDDPGVMIALYPPEDLAAELAIPGGEDPDDLHVTLCYLGRRSGLPAGSLARVERAVKLAAMAERPLSGSIGGVGRFPASVSSDGMGVLIALVDVPGLVEFRQAVAANLSRFGLEPVANHGFTPHLTLDYVDADAPPDLPRLESRPVAFRAVWVVVGDRRVKIPFGMHARRTKDRLGRVRHEAVANYAAEHAPHSMTIAGHDYRGGEFIPAEAMAKASPAELAEVQGAGSKSDPGSSPDTGPVPASPPPLPPAARAFAGTPSVGRRAPKLSKADLPILKATLKAEKRALAEGRPFEPESPDQARVLGAYQAHLASNENIGSHGHSYVVFDREHGVPLVADDWSIDISKQRPKLFASGAWTVLRAFDSAGVEIPATPEITAKLSREKTPEDWDRQDADHRAGRPRVVISEEQRRAERDNADRLDEEDRKAMRARRRT